MENENVKKAKKKASKKSQKKTKAEVLVEVLSPEDLEAAVGGMDAPPDGGGGGCQCASCIGWRPGGGGGRIHWTFN
jgi:hypothetical protein